MFKIRAILAVSVTMFLLYSSVNMVPARSFLESITDISKRQGDGVDYTNYCYGLGIRCSAEEEWNACPSNPQDFQNKCTTCLYTSDTMGENVAYYCLPDQSI